MRLVLVRHENAFDGRCISQIMQQFLMRHENVFFDGKCILGCRVEGEVLIVQVDRRGS